MSIDIEPSMLTGETLLSTTFESRPISPVRKLPDGLLTATVQLIEAGFLFGIDSATGKLPDQAPFALSVVASRGDCLDVAELSMDDVEEDYELAEDILLGLFLRSISTKPDNHNIDNLRLVYYPVLPDEYIEKYFGEIAWHTDHSTLGMRESLRVMPGNADRYIAALALSFNPTGSIHIMDASETATGTLSVAGSFKVPKRKLVAPSKLPLTIAGNLDEEKFLDSDPDSFILSHGYRRGEAGACIIRAPLGWMPGQGQTVQLDNSMIGRVAPDCLHGVPNRDPRFGRLVLQATSKRI